MRIRSPNRTASSPITELNLRVRKGVAAMTEASVHRVQASSSVAATACTGGAWSPSCRAMAGISGSARNTS